jgi:hypothetical protein
MSKKNNLFAKAARRTIKSAKLPRLVGTQYIQVTTEGNLNPAKLMTWDKYYALEAQAANALVPTTSRYNMV